MDYLKIGSINLCLGLKNKKALVKQLLNENSIDVLSMQEVEVETDFDVELLKLPGYILELENNTVKKRVGCFI